MSIRSSIHASLFVALLAPAVASADGGVIRFVGAVVEPSSCMPRVTHANPAARPTVACAPVRGQGTFDPALRVKTSVVQVPAEGPQAGRAASKRYVVTLEYI
ncbi:hypothetical protein [Achromobacter sp. MFA1 R4]|uniref:hypothetical protein n=1 Tax=Achromobacter sp. MFA1 R4 TaxID=1881016 RepID=UPI00095390D4|nr:hypothetical protein [Achromobacter sp. MFA1 R4]SIT31515.1 hypothetical protein SAMN05428937_5026 [Achromobacter sp. MFA1 R4]